MKRKNLEKAVLLTVMLMSLNGVAGAAETDSEEFLLPLDPVNATNQEQVIMVNSPYETAVIIMPQGSYDPANGAVKADNSNINVIGQGKFRAEFHSENAGWSANGIQILNNSTLNFDVSDATVLVTGTSANAAGLTANMNSHLTANNLFINVDGGTNYNDGLVLMYGSDADVANAVVTVKGGAGENTGIGVYGGNFNADTVNVSVSSTGGTNSGLFLNPGLTANQKGVATIGGGNITVDGGDNAYGIFNRLSTTTFNENITATAKNATGENSAVLSWGGNLTFNGAANLNASGGTQNGAVAARTWENSAANVTFANDVNIIGDEKGVSYAAVAEGAGTAIDFQKSLTTTGGNNAIVAANGASIKVNSGKTGVVNYTGVTQLQGNNGIIEMNLTNADSAWNLTGDSVLTTLENSGAVIDMTQDANAYSKLTVNSDMTGNGGVIKMDIDGTKNADNSDRIFVDGTHNGEHYITLNSVGANADGAKGTVLVSVNNETGRFIANDVEGALYWNSFELDSKQSTEAGYNTDWYISSVEQQADKGTTSVDTIVGANALNYHTWRAENDQLMRRMGELRNNGADEEGAWFRVHGSKINRDDSMSFENKYTTYELGYDQVTKQTDDMTRYTGAALSYTDGSSSYDSGSGENHSKAIAFYNTDIYNSGHYLDLVFKYANMDNDFNVYDTNNNKISGEYKNTGISVSAEYGRKNDLKNGWYVEPQAQLTLGYFGGDEYKTSNGISVDQSGIASVLGRVGFNIGKQIGDSGVIYAKANLLHEFAGDYDIDMYDSAGNHRAESVSFNDTWFEYGVGAALKTGKNNHLYFDLAKTAGGDFEKEWTWNAGMRWTF